MSLIQYPEMIRKSTCRLVLRRALEIEGFSRRQKLIDVLDYLLHTIIIL
jgi:hypothetical protein